MVHPSCLQTQLNMASSIKNMDPINCHFPIVHRTYLPIIASTILA